MAVDAELWATLRLMRGGVGAILTAGELNEVMAVVDDRRCATCRWAEVDDDLLQCEAITWVYGAATIVANPHDGQYASGTHLRVSPDFGCVMWEAKS